MAALEILSVSTPDETPEQLWDTNIDSPAAGAELDNFVLHVAAWALGRSAPALAVELVSGEQVVAVAPLRVARPDLAATYPRVPDADRSGMALDVDARTLPQEFELELRVILESGERVQIGSITGRRADPSEVPEPVRSAPTLRDEVRELVLKVGPSGLNGIHPEQDAVLDRLALQGAKVLDIGAGLGARSRAVRDRGAAIVDGFESDVELVRIARLLNAYHQATRVSFYHHDITQPDAYREHYGVVLALSVYTEVEPVLGNIAEITEGVFVTNVPDVSTGLASIGKSFQFHQLLWKADGPSGGHVIAAARDKDALASALRSGEASEVAR